MPGCRPSPTRAAFAAPPLRHRAASGPSLWRVSRRFGVAILLTVTGSCGGDPGGPAGPDGSVPTENLSAELLVVSGLMHQPTDAEIPTDVYVTGPGYTARPGATVTITADTPGASVVNGVLTAGADGVARGAVLKLGSALGPYSFSATASPSYSTSPSTITITAVSGHPAQIERVAGDSQVVTAGGALRAPATVRVTDAAGRIVPNARVTWSPVTAQDSSCINSVTDWQGTDSCGWHPTSPGTVELTASIPGAATRFSATALPVPASFTFVSAPDTSLEVRTSTDLPPVVVEVRLTDGTPGRGYPVTIGHTGIGGTLALPREIVTTDSNGRASTPWSTTEIPSRLELLASLDGVKQITTSVRTYGTPAFIAIAPGRSHTCGLAGWMGLICWGSNTVQQAGGPVGGPDQLTLFALINHPVHAARIRSLGDYSCLLDDVYVSRDNPYQDVLMCWGLGPDGVLTFGAPTQVPLTAYQLPGLDAAKLDGAISGRVDGALHACVRTATPSLYCVGRNDHGQLGDGTTTDRSTATLVLDGATIGLPSLGESHSCAIASGGASYCWGRNDAGQLGDGTFTDRSTPTLVSGGQVFTALALGVAHSCGLTASGAAYCWGDNSHGELGTGSIGGTVPTPTLVAGGLVFKAVNVGDHHTCGVRTDGVAYCWGQNTHGQLGDGTTTDRTAPTRVLDLHAPR